MSNEKPESPGVYKAITEVTADLSKDGIGKDKTCTQGASFKYRSIDDAYNALAPFLAKRNLCILPRMLKREQVERVSGKGNALFYTVVEAEYDFVCSLDGSKHTVGPIYGESMDSGDKGTGKAMSYAYKSMAFQTFSIPTEGDNDPDSQVHDVRGKQQKMTSADWGKIFDDECEKNIVAIKAWRLKHGAQILSTIANDDEKGKLKSFLDDKEKLCVEVKK